MSNFWLQRADQKKARSNQINIVSRSGHFIMLDDKYIGQDAPPLPPWNTESVGFDLPEATVAIVGNPPNQEYIRMI